jgi:SAM-dependent methyltransferase
MKRDLLDILVCPECKSKLQLEVQEEDGEIITGLLSCEAQHEYPITRGVPRFVDADQYAGTFSKQRLYVRRHFEEYKTDDSGDRVFIPSTGFSPEDIRTGLTLEVGCGYGRFIDVVERLGGTIVGIDLSTHSIDLAHDFAGRRPNVHLVQCDLFKLPFPEKTFDRVFSLGVLHHTPSTYDAFAAIVPYVREDGQISIWVYHPKTKVAADRWRKVTTHLPHSMLYWWCILNQALFSWLRVLPGGDRFSQLIPGANPRRRKGFWRRVLSDFDNLSPQYAHTHTEDEVRQWFEGSGLKDVRSLDYPTAITGRGP